MTWKPKVEELEFRKRPAEKMVGPERGKLKICRDR